MIKAIIFDLWDTLIYTGDVHPVLKIRKKLGLDRVPINQFTNSFMKSIMLKRYDNVFEELNNVLVDFERREERQLLGEIVEVWRECVRGFEFPAILGKGLKELGKKHKLGILTNTDSFSIDHVVNKYRMGEYFDAIVTSCDAGVLKPEFKIFDLVLEKLETKPEEACMIGDDPVRDMKPARMLGMKTVFFDRRNLLPNTQIADIRVENFEGLISLLNDIIKNPYTIFKNRPE